MVEQEAGGGSVELAVSALLDCIGIERKSVLLIVRGFGLGFFIRNPGSREG